MSCACLDIWLYLIEGFYWIVVVEQYLDRSLNGFGIASDGGAVVVQDGAFMLEVLDAATHVVPDVGVLRDYTQGEFLATTADDQRRETIDGGSG